ncbi:MAG: beta-galactosidase trimerization domain-containing protein, partial [Candidatus Firestonebacteria bacterium]
MRNKLKVVSVVVLLAFGIVWAEENTFKIDNGGFEGELWNYDNNLPAKGWRWNIDKDVLFDIIERDTKIKKEGESSLHLKDTNTGKTNEGIYYQLNREESQSCLGKTVRLTGWIKQIIAKPAKGVRIGISVLTTSKNWINEFTYPEIEDETDWTQYSVTFKVPDDIVAFRVFVYCALGWGSTGEAYFDDLKLTILDAAKIDGQKENVITSDVVADSSAKNETILTQAGSHFYVFDDALRPNWIRTGWGGIILDETDLTAYSGKRGIRIKPQANANALCGFRFITDSKNRMPDMLDYSANNGWLEFVIKPVQKLQISLTNNEKTFVFVSMEKYLQPLKDSWYKAKIPLEVLTKGASLDKFSGIYFQFLEKPSSEQIELDEVAIVSDKNLPEPKAQLDKTIEKSLKNIIGEKKVWTQDKFERPEIRNGTFYIREEPHFYIGPFHNDSDIDFKGEKSKREGYGNIKYYDELLTDKTAKEIGFTSLQLSSTPIAPMFLKYDLPIGTGILDKAFFYPGFLKGLNGMPFVIDYANIGLWDGLPENKLAIIIKEGKYTNEILQQNTDWHQFIPLCPEHPIGIEIYKAYWRTGAYFTLNNSGNPFIYELINESGYNCSCKYNREEFAKRMEVRYKTIEKANGIWDAKFSSFAEASGVEKFEEYLGVWVDWAKFMGDRYVEFLKTGINAIREIDKRENIYFTEQPAIFNFNSPRGATLNYKKIADLLDVVCIEGGVQFGYFEPDKNSSDMEAVLNQKNITGMLYLDMATALAKGKPVINNELYCGRFANKLRVPTKREDFITSLWSEVIHGSSASFFYSWDKRSFDWRTFEEAKKNVLYGGWRAFSMLNPYSYPPESHKGIKDFETEIGKLSKIVLPYPRIKGTVALLFSYPTLRASAITQLDTAKLIIDYYSSLLFLHYPIEILYEEDLVNTDLTKYQALIIPFIDNSYPETLSIVKSYAGKGGIVLCNTGAFDADEYGKPINYNELLGLRKEKIVSCDDKFVAAEQGSAINNTIEIPIKINYEIITTTAEVLLRTKNGKNLLLKKEIGKGKVYYVSADMETDGITAILPKVLENVKKYGEVINESGYTISNTEFQMLDRGETKLLYLVDWDNISKFALLKLYNTPEKDFYICDPIKEEIYLSKKGKKQWTKDEAKNGISVILPTQVRVVLLAQEQEPKGCKEISIDELKLRFDKIAKTEVIESEVQKKEQEEINKQKLQARKYEGVIAEKCFSVDLTKYVNMGFKDEIDGDKKGGWFDQGSNDLRNMVLGKQVLGGVPFEIIDPDKNNGKSCIILSGGPRQYFPDKITDISVNKKANKFYFLHTIGWGTAGTLFSYVVHYENGDVVEIPVDNDSEVSGWWDPKEIPNAKIAFETNNLVSSNVGLYCHLWKNP